MTDVSRETELFLSQALSAIKIAPEKKTLDQFKQYLSLIKYWNEKKNITSIKEDKDIILKHFVDSLGIIYATKLEKQKIIDIGTGAGLPGVPLKIMFPNLSVTFVDSSKGKIEILNTICNALGFDNVYLLAQNIENIGQDPKYREQYDICVSRALAPLNILLEYGIPLIRNDGELFLYKGPNYQEEVENSQSACQILNAKIKNIIDFKLPFIKEPRAILVVDKIGKTPEKYPRRVGIPRKRPL